MLTGGFYAEITLGYDAAIQKMFYARAWLRDLIQAYVLQYVPATEVDP